MRKKERYEKVLAWFRENRPVAETELHYETPFQLLIAVILSAQCTDKRVNMITPALFRDFPTPEDMAASTSEVIFEYIRSVSYPNNKSKHLVGMAKMLMSDFDGVVPSDIDELQKLPGVGRKSANLIMGDVFGKPAIVTDTDCIRLCNKIGLVDGIKEPQKVEMALWKIIPPEEGSDLCHRFVMHGRAVCNARKPECEKCCLNDICRYAREQSGADTAQ